MFSVSTDAPPGLSPPVVAVLDRLFMDYAPEGATERAVTACVRNAAHAVRFFGDDPGVHSDLVERIARNELDILVGRDSDRART